LISEVIKGEENLAILRKAFKATLEDPKFLAQTKKSKLLIEYVSPEEIESPLDNDYGLRIKSFFFLLIQSRGAYRIFDSGQQFR
jgi:hypothetical protein